MLSPISKAVVAYDGSEMSKKALERAIMLAKLDKKLVINVLTVAEVTLLPLERNVKLEKAKESMLEVEEKLKAIPNKTETYNRRTSWTDN
ncbi:universal stress protein [Psychrobacillus sp. NPDC096426]|uniref:universal stress protein n=1 Tax=Psychrobacillus sp. NPDC096426 TaxID=3364491 RepID=UPI0038307FBC